MMKKMATEADEAIILALFCSSAIRAGSKDSAEKSNRVSSLFDINLERATVFETN